MLIEFSVSLTAVPLFMAGYLSNKIYKRRRRFFNTMRMVYELVQSLDYVDKNGKACIRNEQTINFGINYQNGISDLLSTGQKKAALKLFKFRRDFTLKKRASYEEFIEFYSLWRVETKNTSPSMLRLLSFRRIPFEA